MRKRVFRIIQYEGEAQWVERQVANSIHGKVTLPQGTISAVTVGEFGESIDLPEDESAKERGGSRDDIGRRAPGQIAGNRDPRPTDAPRRFCPARSGSGLHERECMKLDGHAGEHIFARALKTTLKAPEDTYVPAPSPFCTAWSKSESGADVYCGYLEGHDGDHRFSRSYENPNRSR